LVEGQRLRTLTRGGGDFGQNADFPLHPRSIHSKSVRSYYQTNQFKRMRKKRNFFIECIPPKTTHQASKRIFKTKGGNYFLGKSKRGKDVENELISLFLMFRPIKATARPVHLEITWIFPWRKNEPKKNRVDGLLAMPVRPDLDNLAKGAIDAMTLAGYWEEDSQITRLSLSKYWGERPGIKVSYEVE